MTTTDIANVALKALGAGRIADINAADRVSTACRESMDAAINDFANKVVINAMITRQALVASVDPVDGYLYCYVLPTSPVMIRPLRLETGLAFYREGGKLHTDDSAAVLVYVGGVVDTADLPEYACLAIAYKLAILIIFDMGKDARMGTVAALYEDAVSRARAFNGRDNNPGTVTTRWGS